MADRRPALDPALAERLGGLASGVGLMIREVAFPAQVGLRVQPGSAEARAIEAALGFSLPGANRVAGAAGRDVLWLGPDEWLVVGDAGTEHEIEGLLRGVAGEGLLVVVDLSANRTVLEIAGDRAREVLGSCCHLDLHPRVFGPGDCAQTLLQKAPIIIQQTDATPAYRLFVRPSLAAYVAAWLAEGAAGLG